MRPYATQAARLLLVSLAILALIIAAPAPLARASIADTWRPIGPAGSKVLNIAVTPASFTTVYATLLDGGIIRSPDNGINWLPINSGLPVQLPVLVTVVLDPQTPATLYAAGDGVYRSSNGGDNWAPATTGLPTNAFVRALAINPSTPQILFAAIEGSGIYRTTNGGGVWAPVVTGLSDLNVRSIAIDPGEPTLMYAGTGDGVFRSIDGGTTWNPSRSGLPSNSKINTIQINPIATDIVYAGTNESGVYRSMNNGGTWSAINAGLPSGLKVNALAMPPSSAFTIYAAARSGGIYVSNDGGSAWSSVSGGLPSLEVTDLAINPLNPGATYASINGGGVYTLNLAPLLVLNYTNGAPGSAFLVSGGYLPPSTNLQVRINGVALSASVATDAHGKCTFLLSTDAAAADGLYLISVDTVAGDSGIASYRLDSNLPVRTAPSGAPAPILVPATTKPLDKFVYVPVVRR